MSTPDNSDQAEFWSAAAGRKWAARQAELDILMQPVLDGVLARAELTPKLRVLDIGCGAGAGCLAAANAVGDEGAVLGVDVSLPRFWTSRGSVPPPCPKWPFTMAMQPSLNLSPPTTG